MVSRVKNQPFGLALLNPCGDAGPPDGEIGATFQTLHREQIGFAGQLEGLPGAAFRGGMNETTYQQVVALMGCPQQFKTGHWRTFAQFLAVTDQAFGDGEMVGLVDQCKPGLLKAFLDSGYGETRQVKAQYSEQINGGDAVFDRNAIPPLQHHGLTAGEQHQRGEWVDRGRACATVKWHAETERRPLTLCTGQHRTKSTVGIEHASEFLRLRPADAMGDQEGSDLSWGCHPIEHEMERIGSLLPAHPLAGVLTTANFAQVLLEAFPTVDDAAGHRCPLS